MPPGCGGESRLERARRLREPLGLPELDGGQYLVDAMFRLGPTRSAGMGEAPADWPEIDAFARATGRISEPWEAEALFDMCRAYHAAREAGTDPLAMSPAEIEAEAAAEAAAKPTPPPSPAAAVAALWPLHAIP
ncbi:MAG: hypothetical protein V7668_16560 [Cereibacter changlensis]